MSINGRNLGRHLGIRANFFYDAILNAILEFSSNSYISACTRGTPAILVSTTVFVGKNTTQAFPTPKNLHNYFGHCLSRHFEFCSNLSLSTST